MSEYDDPKLGKLRAPVIDARRLAAVLENPDIGGFEVDTALDEDEGSLRRRISRFFRDRRPDDLLLIHFSCHGVKDDSGELYLAARDTEVADLSATGISSDWLSRQIDRSRSRRAVVLLDCCFSGSFPFGLRARAGGEVNVHEHLEGRGRAVITASNALEYSYEGDELSGEGRPSIFTDAVVEGLESGKADRDSDKWISVDELYDYVYERVRAHTPSQNPNKMSTLEGSLHIARSVYQPPVEPAELDAELIALIEHPMAGARLGAVDELARLLGWSNKSVALAARQTLERMTSDDSRTVAERATQALAELDDEPGKVIELGDEPEHPPPAPKTATFELLESTHLSDDSSTSTTLNAVTFSPEATRIATVCLLTVLVWDTASGRELARLKHLRKALPIPTDEVGDLAFSPDGSRLVTVLGFKKTAYIWDVASGRDLACLKHDGWVDSVAFSPDGTRIATGLSLNKTARVWDLASGRELARLKHDGWVSGVALSPDGTRIVTDSKDTARVWDVASGRELARLKHDGTVLAVAFSPDGTRIVTASGGTVLVWDAASGRELARLKHDGTVRAVAFSPDAVRIATFALVGKVKRGWSGYANVWGIE